MLSGVCRFSVGENPGGSIAFAQDDTHFVILLALSTNAESGQDNCLSQSDAPRKSHFPSETLIAYTFDISAAF
jgi:hypothetical protein